MLNTSNARIRLVLVLVCLTGVFVLSLVIMGTVGVNGHITFENLDDGCLLYMSLDNKVVSYNNGKQSESDSQEVVMRRQTRTCKKSPMSLLSCVFV